MDFNVIQLETERLVLKRVHIDTHGEEINKCVCDTLDSLRPWIAWAKEKPTVQETKLGLHRVAGSPLHYCFRIYLQNNSSMIGTCGLVFKENKTYEVGYWLHKIFVGNGYMYEAIQRLIKFAKDDIKGETLVLIAQERNKASCKVAEKCGFILDKKCVEKSSVRPEWGEFINLYYKKVLDHTP